ncbi:stage II sporulation protein M [Pseudomonas sp.]|uniref:stage II sporulation protein M n=1 Tax=Pseudomonas sp. TaxID=306 RepID=UPI002BD2F778|nr:stage II sporulation protein M [Pseudomonas sp.]HUE90474.1 stage II sporulation protein M [Pseudomonas sp.]
MNLDRFVALHQPTWHRLGLMASRNPSELSADDIATFVADYQRSSTHLSMARRTYADPDLTGRLSQLVATAGATLYGSRPRTLAAVARFFTETFPGAMWHLRWHIAVATGIFLGVAFGLGAWVAASPQALDAAIPQNVQDALVAGDFVEYYSDRPSGQFFAEVGLNNIQVGFLAFSVGIAAGLPTVYVLLINAANVGFAGGLFHARGVAEVFWGFITPHGLIELTAVFIAAGMGLALGWSWIDPGELPRIESLRRQASRAITVVIGLLVVFGVAAIIEGFITGSPLPTWVRVGVGVVVEGAFLTYAWMRGRAAAGQGLTGTLGQADRPLWDAVG